MGYDLKLEIGYLEGDEVSIKRKFVDIIEETRVVVTSISFESSYSEVGRVRKHLVEVSIPLEVKNIFQAHTEANKILREQVDLVLEKHELEIIRFDVKSGG